MMIMNAELERQWRKQ